MKRVLEASAKAIRLKSHRHSGTEELVGFLGQLMEERGFQVSQQKVYHSLEDVSPRQYNLIGVLGDPLVDRKTRKGLMLLTHLDTVGPGLVSNWSRTFRDPYRALATEEEVVGLGAVDAKCDFISKIFIGGRFREARLKEPLYLVGTCGGELDWMGARYLLESNVLNPKWIVIHHPSRLQIVKCTPASSALHLQIEFATLIRDTRGFNRRVLLRSFGRTAHAAFSQLGRNALYELIELLRVTRDNGFEFRLRSLQGGGIESQVPDLADAEVYFSSHQFEDFKRFFREYLSQTGSEGLFDLELGGMGEAGLGFTPLEAVESVFRLQDWTAEQQGLLTEGETLWMRQLKINDDRLDFHFEIISPSESRVAQIFSDLESSLTGIMRDYPRLGFKASKEALLNEYAHDPELTQLATEVLQRMDLPGDLEESLVPSEAGLFQKAGYPVIAMGPGEVEHIHAPNERVDYSEIKTSAAFVQKLIEKLCL